MAMSPEEHGRTDRARNLLPNPKGGTRYFTGYNGG